MSERVVARELARTTGMSYLEAITYYQVLAGLEVAPDKIYDVAADCHTRMGLAAEQLAEMIQPYRHLRAPKMTVDRRRIDRLMLEAAWRHGASEMVDRLATPPQADTTVTRLRARHLEQLRGPAPARSYPGGAVDWTTGHPLQEGHRP